MTRWNNVTGSEDNGRSAHTQGPCVEAKHRFSGAGRSDDVKSLLPVLKLLADRLNGHLLRGAKLAFETNLRKSLAHGSGFRKVNWSRPGQDAGSLPSVLSGRSIRGSIGREC